MKPSLFIGSSSEKLIYAYALQEQLSGSADVTLWNQGFFALNTSYLAVRISLFGIVVGIALLLSGLGFGILAIGGALRTASSGRAETPAQKLPAAAVPVA